MQDSLDTLRSTLIGHDSNGNPQSDTKRSELVYRR
jgi:hypothetical protein